MPAFCYMCVIWTRLLMFRFPYIIFVIISFWQPEIILAAEKVYQKAEQKLEQKVIREIRGAASNAPPIRVVPAIGLIIKITSDVSDPKKQELIGKIPPECSFALLPYRQFYNKEFLENNLDKNIDNRHILTILPFKNQENSINLYGPLTIEEQAPLEENARKLAHIIEFSRKTKGILLDSAVMAKQNMLFLELTGRYLHYTHYNKGKLFLYPGELIEKTNMNIADQLFIQERFEGYPLEFDLIIGDNLATRDIYAKLDELAEIARSKGRSIAVINDDNINLACLLRWLEVVMRDKQTRAVRLIRLDSIY